MRKLLFLLLMVLVLLSAGFSGEYELGGDVQKRIMDVFTADHWDSKPSASTVKIRLRTGKLYQTFYEEKNPVPVPTDAENKKGYILCHLPYCVLFRI